jgi:tRNA threonylcarbamoyladenosine biosynthesis protein TsaB
MAGMQTSPLLLLLETATAVCSVAVCRGTEILALQTSKMEREHASMLTVYIREVMALAGFNLRDLDAVVVSKGPGSYTGLRIGVAAAKGICFTLNKPLIAVDTHLAMAAQYNLEYGADLNVDDVLVPVIDARRMEVYGAAFNRKLDYRVPVCAEVLHPGSFITDISSRHVFFGDGAAKCTEIFSGNPSVRIDKHFNLSASGLLLPSNTAWLKREFADTAYFEPYYLKEFVAKLKSSSR